MPAKGRRIASRQAQLNRRKRRQQRPGENLIGAATEAAPPVESEDVEASTEDLPEVSRPRTSAATAVAAPPRRTMPPPARARTQAQSETAYAYVIPELRRIVIMAGVLIIALIVLSFVL